MPTTVRVRIPQFPDPLVDSATMREVGDLAVRMIVTRTRSGKDVTGAAFQPYTPGYAERRAKEGHPASPVNLTVSGRMLNDLAVMKTGPGRVTLGFRSSGGGGTRGKGLTLIQRSRSVGAEDKARAHDIDGVGAARTKRRFMGLTDGELGTIRERVARYLSELAKRI